jgi:hypothetical protein
VSGQDVGDRSRPTTGDPLDDVGDDVEQTVLGGAAEAGDRLRDQWRPAVADLVGDNPSGLRRGETGAGTATMRLLGRPPSGTASCLHVG